MSLSVIAEPGYLSLSKNPVEFHLRSSAYVLQQPVAGVYGLLFGSKLTTVGRQHIFEFDGNTVAMTVQATTTPSGYNLPNDIAATTTAQYVQALAETWFPAQYLLEKYFIIEYVAPDIIRFTAKDPATVLTVTTTTPGTEAAWTTATAPVQLLTADDYNVIMDVEVEETYGSGVFTRIGTLHASPVLYDDAGTLKGDFKLDVAEILDGFLQNRTDVPDVTSTTAFIADNTNLQWRAVYAERFSLTGTTIWVRRIQSDTKRVLKGGLKYLDVPAVGDLETLHFAATNKPWNSWMPDVRHVTATEKHWFYFLTEFDLTGVEKFRTVFDIFYTDGTTDTTGLDDVTTQEQWETFAYAIGFNQRGLESVQPTKTAYRYDVQIIVLPSVPHVTLKKTFYLVDETRQDRYFLYENSMQGWETLRCNGDMEATATVAKTEALNMVQAGYAATDAVVQQNSQGYSDAFTVFTGYKTKAEAIHLREFINSENYYEVIGDTLVPIVVDAASFQLEYDRTGEYAYGLKFRYRHAFINKGYSNA